jgi:hypothetical protein
VNSRPSIVASISSKYPSASITKYWRSGKIGMYATVSSSVAPPTPAHPASEAVAARPAPRRYVRRESRPSSEFIDRSSRPRDGYTGLLAAKVGDDA